MSRVAYETDLSQDYAAINSWGRKSRDRFRIAKTFRHNSDWALGDRYVYFNSKKATSGNSRLRMNHALCVGLGVPMGKSEGTVGIPAAYR